VGPERPGSPKSAFIENIHPHLAGTGVLFAHICARDCGWNPQQWKRCVPCSFRWTVSAKAPVAAKCTASQSISPKSMSCLKQLIPHHAGGVPAVTSSIPDHILIHSLKLSPRESHIFKNVSQELCPSDGRSRHIAADGRRPCEGARGLPGFHAGGVPAVTSSIPDHLESSAFRV